jgi:hypothetical protein
LKKKILRKRGKKTKKKIIKNPTLKDYVGKKTQKNKKNKPK